ncbi:hypothetical protein SHIRM173S_07934 [Streptomyces hirsutus]
MGLGEAVGVVGAEVGSRRTGRRGARLVVAEVGAGEVAVEVGGEDLGVRVGAEAGQGEAVGAAGVADLAGQEQVADAFAERVAAAGADQPGGGEARAPFVGEEGFQLGVGDRGRVGDEVLGEAFGVRPPGAQETAAVQFAVARVVRPSALRSARSRGRSRSPRGAGTTWGHVSGCRSVRSDPGGGDEDVGPTGAWAAPAGLCAGLFDQLLPGRGPVGGPRPVGVGDVVRAAGLRSPELGVEDHLGVVGEVVDDLGEVRRGPARASWGRRRAVSGGVTGVRARVRSGPSGCPTGSLQSGGIACCQQAR